MRSVAVLSLERYGLEAAQRGATRSLMDALLDPHWKVRGNAACALPEMGSSAEVAVSRLEGALLDDTEYVRNCAMRALSELERADQESAPRSSWVRPLDLRQRLLDVRNDIVGVLDATRITDETVRDAQFESLRLRNVPE